VAGNAHEAANARLDNHIKSPFITWLSVLPIFAMIPQRVSNS